MSFIRNTVEKVSAAFFGEEKTTPTPTSRGDPSSMRRGNWGISGFNLFDGRGSYARCFIAVLACRSFFHRLLEYIKELHRLVAGFFGESKKVGVFFPRGG